MRRARDRDTPFYVFDARSARQSARQWRLLAKRHDLDVFYPYKCNRHPALLRLLAREGLGAEATASRDLETALRLRLPGGRIVFQGPAKSDAAVDLALVAGVLLVADGVEDASAILDRARSLAISPRYLLRFAAAAADGEQRRFGMSPGEVRAFARRLRDRREPPPEGLAFHLGTGIATPGPYLSAIAEAGRIAKALKGLGFAVTALDLGGGFPAEGERRRDARGRPRKAAAPLENFIGDLVRRAASAVPGARLSVEPGRGLASDAFHLVARVLRVRGRRVHVDASRMSHALFVPRGKHPFRPVPYRTAAGAAEIAGPLPVGLDVLSTAERIGRPREGDLLVIGSVGAYNLIAGNAWAGERASVVEI